MKNLQRTPPTVAASPKYSIKKLEISNEDYKMYLAEFEKFLRVLGYARSTVYYFPSYVRAFLNYLEGKKVFGIEKIRIYHVKNFFDILSKRQNVISGNFLSRNYQLNYLNALKRFSRYLKECHNIIADFPVKILNVTERERTCLSEEQIRTLYQACREGASGDLDRMLLSLYYGLGLRRSEAINLNLEDISITNKLVHVRRTKTGRDRYVPMSTAVYSEIIGYISGSRKRALKTTNKNEQALIISEKGLRISGNAVYERLQKLAGKASLKVPFSIHTLRHSIATHLLLAGMKLESISGFLGHKSLESTQVYTHLVMSNLK
jgi:integrase/recombinase XerD